MEKWKNGKKLQTTNLRLVIGDCLLPTANLPQTLFCRQPGTADCQLATADFALPFALCALQNRRMES